jgi:hypothetical protein
LRRAWTLPGDETAWERPRRSSPGQHTGSESGWIGPVQAVTFQAPGEVRVEERPENLGPVTILPCC